MKISNQELVQKGIIKTDAIAASGKLSPEQADKFIDYVFDLTKLRQRVRTVKFKPDQLDIDKIGVGARVALSKNEATDPGRRRGLTTSKIILTPKEVMVPFEISDDFGEYNIEEGDIYDHIIKMMATQLGNDLEELALDGDLLGPARIADDIYPGESTTQCLKDTFMGLHDGWLKRALGGNIVDCTNTNINDKIFNNLLNAMPEKYKRDKRNLRYFTSSTIEQNYRQVTSARQTAKGDEALSSQANLTPYGTQLDPIPMFNTNPRVTKHVQLNATTAVALGFTGLVAGSEIVTISTLVDSPVTPYIAGTDYTFDAINGTLVRIGAGAISDGQTVKITFQTDGQIMLTEYRNLIFGMCRDVRIEKDRDIYKGVNQYAITVKISNQIENLEAVVFGKNVGTSV